MRVKRKIMLCAVALVGIGLGPVSIAEAQVCRYIGVWTRTEDGYVCAGSYLAGNCTWSDDCRKNVE